MAAETNGAAGVLVPRTLVVPLDGSALSEAALPLAHLLAAQFRATVQTVTVGHVARAGGSDVALQGDPVGALVDHLGGIDGALVCMSSHGRGGIRRRLVGSVAEGLLRRAPAPVIVTGPEVQRGDIGVPRTLLAGISLSPNHDRLLALLGAWAPLLGARMELAHVRLPSAAELYVSRTTGRLPADRPDLERLAARLRTRGVRARPHVLPGADPQDALLALAGRLTPPVLVAVDTHHGDDPGHHDVAYTLIRRSRWPVLASVGT
jgi:nucleotide-binding universal stress UspA family protein